LPNAAHEAGTVNIPDRDVAVVDGESVEVVHFDFEAIDQALGTIENASADARTEAAELLSALLVWVFPPGIKVRGALVRFAAMTAGLRPDLMEGTYQSLASECHCSKQAVSKAAMRFQGAFNFKFGRSRSLAARNNMARSQA